MAQMSVRWLLMAFGVLGLGAARVDAGGKGDGDPVHACQAAKLKVASQEIGGKMKCAAAAPDPACAAKVTAKADAGYAKAGDLCIGDGEAFHAAVDACVATLEADASGTGRCPTASRRALGKGAANEVKCHATEIVKPGTFAACDAKEDAATAKALGRAGACGQTPATTIAADIDGCDAALEDVIVPTSTTTTTTTTTSTTQPTNCGGGFLCDTPTYCDPGLECGPDQSHHCICETAPSCGYSQYPTCGGACPDGLVCVPQYNDAMIFNYSVCACVPPDLPCSSTAATCGYGACPPGSACRISSSFTGCTAVCSGP